MKRKLQIDFEEVIDGIIAGSSVRKIIIKGTAGAGKSAIPIIAGKLKTAGIVDALLWTVPRRSLQSQGESNFQDPFFREMFNHQLQIRSSTNEPDPCRGLDGFITTHQAIGIDKAGLTLSEIKSKKYALVIDEFHHFEFMGTWFEAFKDIIEHAHVLILMTGTLERGDGKQIAWCPYRAIGKQLEPDLTQTDDTVVIEYTRQDALRDHAILPLKFRFHDGSATWLNDMGKKISVSKLSRANPKNASPAIWTALSTEFAIELIDMTMDHWQKYKRFNRRSKILFVTAGIKHAKRALAYLNRMNCGAELATSHESAEAVDAINRFKYGDTDILVTIAMAYEGLDVPCATHIGCLTHIRSNPWIEQMVARVVRIDYGSPLQYEQQFGYIFAPDDPRMRMIVERIKSEQLAVAKEYRPPEQTEMFGEQKDDDDQEFDNPFSIVPLQSSLTGNRRETLAHGSGHQGILTPSATRIKTPSEIEKGIRDQVDHHVKLFCFKNRHRHQRINAEIKSYFGKARSDMTVSELGRCLAHVQRNYRIDRIRGTGRPRVSTKVTEFRG